ncbi:hypothetical protein A1O3_01017 [Capronia epimyces CBS 606.96]|uniref:Phenylacetyl-CoA ligase n=1 Tax=Capronia epimyces CBS 606.96 TaxID=1182542 RepID=W9YT89_9EURO|nr:uncharacterized protein A1O3_01017 [Capronia epimyces CBS 606.96]EXJ92466.1 hypothetical protein A1O3_01017 [Capronia epimyces CBS 606.96]
MPIPSQYPEIPLPEIDINTFLFERVDRTYPDSQILFRDAATDRAYTYEQIKTLAEDFGRGLVHHLNWKKGDVLATVAANAIETPSITLGALRAGGIVSPANPGYTKAELAYQLQDSGAKAVVTNRVALQNVKDACRQIGIPEHNIILLEEDDHSHSHHHHQDRPGQGQGQGQIRSWKSLLVAQRTGTAAERPVAISPKTDLAFLVYSSGTTGRPKGVKLSHYNITSNILQLQIGEQENVTWNGSKTSPGIPGANGQPDVVLSSLPFFHIYGLTVLVLNPIYTGTTSIVMSKFSIETFCEMIQRHKVTYAYVVPPILVLLSKHPCIPNYDLSSIRMMNSGAAPLTEELVKGLYKRTGVRVKQGYGMSETSPSAFFQRWEDWLTTAGSAGWLIPNMQVQFRAVPEAEGEGESSSSDEEEAKELPAGETGEVYLKGPNIFLGYHNNDVATRSCLSADGWFRTGDVGHLDNQGNLFITDRVKELIKYKGFQVPPAELEGYLIDHPSVGDVAVIGFDSKVLATECPRAYVVLANGSAKSASTEQRRAILSWLNQRVANHKKLRGGLEFVDSIPKSASGKILRRVLKAQAKENSEAIEKEIEEDQKLRARL